MGTDGRREVVRVGEVVERLRADIIGLQEIDKGSEASAGSDQLDYLAQLTGTTGIAGPTILRQRGHFGNALLTSFPVTAVRRHDLSVPGYEARGALDVDLDLGAGTLRVLVTHFGLDRAQRNLQADRIVEILASQGREHTVLLGDFNEWLPWSRPLRRLRGRLGKTPWRLTYPARFPLLALDRIWVSPPVRLVRLEKPANPLTRVASDHLPLKAVIELQSPRS